MKIWRRTLMCTYEGAVLIKSQVNLLMKALSCDNLWRRDILSLMKTLRLWRYEGVHLRVLMKTLPNDNLWSRYAYEVVTFYHLWSRTLACTYKVANFIRLLRNCVDCRQMKLKTSLLMKLWISFTNYWIWLIWVGNSRKLLNCVDDLGYVLFII